MSIAKERIAYLSKVNIYYISEEKDRTRNVSSLFLWKELLEYAVNFYGKAEGGIIIRKWKQNFGGWKHKKADVNNKHVPIKKTRMTMEGRSNVVPMMTLLALSFRLEKRHTWIISTQKPWKHWVFKAFFFWSNQNRNQKWLLCPKFGDLT